MRPQWRTQRALLIGLGLTPRSADAAGGRLGLRTGAKETLDALAVELGVTRERVRQIEVRTFARIARRPLAMEIELQEPEILVRLRLAEMRRQRHWAARRHLLADLGLDSREREILVRRFALRGGAVESYRAIGADAGLTGERIRQIENGVIRQLTGGHWAEELASRDPELLALLRERMSSGRRWGVLVRARGREAHHRELRRGATA